MAEVHDIFVRLADFLPCPHDRKIDIEARGLLLRRVLLQRQLARRVRKTLAHQTTDVVEFLRREPLPYMGLSSTRWRRARCLIHLVEGLLGRPASIGRGWKLNEFSTMRRRLLAYSKDFHRIPSSSKVR
jgi:hypothetical protein